MWLGCLYFCAWNLWLLGRIMDLGLTWCEFFPQALSTSAQTYPMFIFAEGHGQEEEQSTTPTHNITYIQRKSERRRVDTSNSLDEFVLLWTNKDQICPEGRSVINDCTWMRQLYCGNYWVWGPCPQHPHAIINRYKVLLKWSGQVSFIVLIFYFFIKYFKRGTLIERLMKKGKG